MKLFYLIILPFSFLFPFNVNCQNLNKDTNDAIGYFHKNDTVYWFYIKIKWNARIKEYNLTVKSPLLSGSLEKYDKSLWRNLQGGKLLVVGPFETEKEAVISKKVYLSIAKNKSLDTSKEEVTLHWFKFKHAISKRKGNFILEAIHEEFSGSYLDFYSDVKQGLKEGYISIGPYRDYDYAKEMTEPRKTNCNM